MEICKLCDLILEFLDDQWNQGIHSEEYAELGKIVASIYEWKEKSKDATQSLVLEIEDTELPRILNTAFQNLHYDHTKSLTKNRDAEARWRNIYMVACLATYIDEVVACRESPPSPQQLRNWIGIVDKALILGGDGLRTTAESVLDDLLQIYHTMDLPHNVQESSVSRLEVHSNRITRLNRPIERRLRPSLQLFTHEYVCGNGKEARPVILIGCMEDWKFRELSPPKGANITVSAWTPQEDRDDIQNPTLKCGAVFDSDCRLVEKRYLVLQSNEKFHEVSLEEIPPDSESKISLKSEYRRSYFDPSCFLAKPGVALRIVPVELGSHYLAEHWTRRLMQFDAFIRDYILKPSSKRSEMGYLAQHRIFDRIPSLASGIILPDYCVVEGNGSIEVNAWIGPEGTLSPLHTDDRDNLLCQVAGFKYVRLYSPGYTHVLYPCTSPGLGNTSQIVDIIGEESKAGVFEQFPGFKEAEYVEGILRPGEMLYIPTGWWHYVESLSPSFSVSFWWNKR